MKRTNIIILVAFATMWLAGCDTADQFGQIAEVMTQAPAKQAEMERNAQQQADEMARQMEAQMRAEFNGTAVPQPAGPKPGQVPVTASNGPTGVPECDEYLAKYPACLEQKVPAMAKGPMLEAFKQTEAAWKQAAATPEGKAALAPQCKMAMDMAKTAMSIYGCKL